MVGTCGGVEGGAAGGRQRPKRAQHGGGWRTTARSQFTSPIHRPCRCSGASYPRDAPVSFKRCAWGWGAHTNVGDGRQLRHGSTEAGWHKGLWSRTLTPVLLPPLHVLWLLLLLLRRPTVRWVCEGEK